MTDFLMTAAFLLTLIPALWLLMKMLPTDWNRPDNPGGRAVVGLLVVICGTAVLSVSVLVLPEAAQEPYAVWIRIIARLGFATVLWNLLRLFYRAQREGREAETAEVDNRLTDLEERHPEHPVEPHDQGPESESTQSAM